MQRMSCHNVIFIIVTGSNIIENRHVDEAMPSFKLPIVSLARQLRIPQHLVHVSKKFQINITCATADTAIVHVWNRLPVFLPFLAPSSGVPTDTPSNNGLEILIQDIISSDF